LLIIVGVVIIFLYHLLISIIALVICAITALIGFQRIKHIQTITFSTASDVKPGLTQVFGTVQVDKNSFIGPVSQEDTVYYECKLQERVGEGLHRKWVTLATVSKATPFILKDSTGTVRVDPHDIDVIDAQKRWYPVDNEIPEHIEEMFRKINFEPYAMFMGKQYAKSIRVVEDSILVGSQFFVSGVVRMDKTKKPILEHVAPLPFCVSTISQKDLILIYSILAYGGIAMGVTIIAKIIAAIL
jgi:hypothetical protein